MKNCKYCGLSGHIATFCYAKPKRTMVSKHKLRQIGKVGQKWLKVRADWFRENPADLYVCYICHETLTPRETTLDHIKSRSRHPELRFDLTNLAPCCFRCNKQKGSRDLEELNVGN